MAWQDIRMVNVDWSDVRAPSLADIANLADSALRRLPEPFRAAVEGVVIRVEEFPDEIMADELDLETPFDLMGLYQGVDLTHRSFAGLQTDVDRIFLFRRAILDQWAESEDSLGEIVTHVLLHEIGHHLGLSDEDMHAIEEAADPRR